MRVIGETYWHVGNSGVTFKIVDEGEGPTFVVESGSFANLKNQQKFYTDKESLNELKKIIDKALLVDNYSKQHHTPASVKFGDWEESNEDESLLKNVIFSKIKGELK